ncbi:MAG: TlpA family protein disulfide reductase [Myxococcales bacterium]|nr:TlpA family protein disulfide reductase [Myxococcales bacterium]MCB9521589.1 TlpA family protein disulfide reductase [Myxococcales bacterium]
MSSTTTADKAFLATIIVAAAAWVAFGVARPAGTGPADTDPRVGTAAATFTLPALENGAPRALEEFRNDAVLIDFWATTCPPCRRSIPLIEQLSEELGGDGLTVVSVNVDMPDDTREALVRGFVAENAMHVDVLLDNGRAAYDYGASRIPIVFVLDRDLKIRRVFRGFTPYDQLRAGIDETIAASRAGST